MAILGAFQALVKQFDPDVCKKVKRWREWMTTSQFGQAVLGILLVLLTSCFVVPVNIIDGLLIKEINVASYIFLRYSVVSFLILPAVLCKWKSLQLSSYSAKEWMAMILSGICRIAGELTFGYALYYIDVYDVTVIGSIKPIMVAILACCVPGERGSFFDIVPLALSVTGSVFIIQPPAIFKGIYVGTLSSIPAVALLLTLSCPLLNAINNISCRKLRTIPLVLTVIMQTVAGLPLMVPLVVFGEGFEVPMTSVGLYQLAVASICYIGRVVTHTYALYFISSIQVTVIDSIKIPMLCLANYVLFNILPNWLKGVGSVLLIAAVSIYLFKLKIESFFSMWRRFKVVESDENALLLETDQ